MNAQDANNQIWHDCLESIKVSVSLGTFNTWFSQTHIASLNDTDKRCLVEIGCPSIFVKNTTESRYFGLIQDTLSKTLDKPCDLVFVVKENPNKTKSKNPTAPLFEKTKEGNNKLNILLSETHVQSLFTFENFAVSSSNQMAWAAADAVSKDLGNAYNPLFIWGGVGVGKTHLLNAIGHSILKEKGNSKILYCTGEDFTNEIVEGIRKKTTSEFRMKYRKLKALFIDDIQFIAGKNTVQEEFFHTFNTLVAAGSQIILASDRPPNEISKLEERIRSRFEAGLIVDIAPPNFELRCAIIQIKSKEMGLEIPMDIVQIIAGNIDFARPIQGFLTKLSSEARLKNSEITSNLVENLLGKGASNDVSQIKASPSDMITAVSKYFSVGKRALLGSSRKRPIARPRQILMYLLRTQLGLPFQEAGRLVGNRDHTTVMHAVDRITHLASTNVQIRQDIRGIKNMF